MSDQVPKPTLSERIEDRIDKTVMSGTNVDMDLGGVQFRSMIEVMDFAKLMSVSDLAVPPHLRNNPGACLAICTKALRNRFDPFALAEHSFAMDKEIDVTVVSPQGGRSVQKQKLQIIAYDSAVIRAVINAHAPIIGTIEYEFKGEGDDRICTASATLQSTGKKVSIDSPTLGQRKKDIGFSDRGNLKGSPLWLTKPDQQQSYDTGRDLCRRYFPETLLGWYDKEEYDENPRDVTLKEVAKPSIGSRLKKDDANGVGPGFGTDNVAKALEHNPGQVLDAAMKPREKEPVPAHVEIAHAQQALEETKSLALEIPVEDEMKSKTEAVSRCTTKDDLTDLVENVTDYLKDVGRTDLLADFLGVVKKREKKLQV